MPRVTDIAGLNGIEVSNAELEHFRRMAWVKTVDNTRYGGGVNLQLHDMIRPTDIQEHLNSYRNGLEIRKFGSFDTVTATMEEVNALCAKGLVHWCFTTYVYDDYSAVMEALDYIRGVKKCA